MKYNVLYKSEGNIRSVVVNAESTTQAELKIKHEYQDYQEVLMIRKIKWTLSKSNSKTQLDTFSMLL